MTRKTVTVTSPKHPEPRTFHLEEKKAERFAADHLAKGGTAVIGPLKLDDGLQAMLPLPHGLVALLERNRRRIVTVLDGLHGMR